MFCRNCGTQNKDDARFCANCGAPIMVAPTQMPVAENPMPQPTADNQMAEAPAMEAYVEETPTVDAPAIDAPAMDSPIAENPLPDVQISETPVYDMPVEEQPAQQMPVEEQPMQYDQQPMQQAPYEQQMPFNQQPMQQMPNGQPMPFEQQMPNGQPMPFNQQPMQQMPNGQPMPFNEQPMQQMPNGQPMPFNQQPMQQMPNGQPMPFNEQPMQQIPNGQPMPFNQPPVQQGPVNDKKAEKAAKKAAKQAQNNGQMMTQDKPKKKGLKIAIILGSVLLVLGGAAAAYLFAPLPFKWPMTKLSRSIDNSKALFNEASQLYNNNNIEEANAKFDEAIAECETVISIEPSNYEAYLTSIYAYEYKDDKSGMQGVYKEFKTQLQEDKDSKKAEDAKQESDNSVNDIKANIFLTAPVIFDDADKVISELEEGVAECNNVKKDEFNKEFSKQYVVKGDSSLATDNYTEALDFYKKALDYNADNQTAVANGNDAVAKYAEDLMASGDYDKVKQLANEIDSEGLFSAGELDKAIEEIEAMEAEQQAYIDFMKQFYDAMLIDDTATLEAIVWDPQVKAYGEERNAEGKNLMLIADDPLSDTGYGVEIYEINNRRIVYLGDFVDGVREGYGKIYSDAGNYYNVGGSSWKNGTPYGDAYLVEAIDGVYSCQYSGNISDGKWDGDIAVEIEDYNSGGHFSTGFEVSSGYPWFNVNEAYEEEYGAPAYDDPDFNLYAYVGDGETLWRIGAHKNSTWGFPGYADIS